MPSFLTVVPEVSMPSLQHWDSWTYVLTRHSGERTFRLGPESLRGTLEMSAVSVSLALFRFGGYFKVLIFEK